MFDRNFGGHREDGSTSFSLDGARVSSHFFEQSSFAAHANVPADCAVKVDPAAPLEILAPLGCGIQHGACAGAILNVVLRPELGSSVAVFGAGAVGLSAVMAAKVAACSVIIAVDRNAERLELAKDLGATHTVLVGDGDAADGVRAIVEQGVEYALETTGVPAVFSAMTRALAPRGSLLPMGVSIRMIVEGESIPSVFIPQLSELYRTGQFPFDRLVKTYPFDQINTAFADSANGSTLKPVVVFP